MAGQDQACAPFSPLLPNPSGLANWPRFRQWTWWKWSLLALGLLTLSLFLPVTIPQDPLSLVVKDRSNVLLGARIAPDEQWRFPCPLPLPEKVATALLLFEDEWFFHHPGVNPVSLAKAAIANWRAGQIVRGGSTITMQLIRLARKGRPRTWREKLIECHAALRLSWRLDKTEVLRLYFQHAPFGGNVVGLTAASWRYYGKAADLLTWGEACTLAILPNSPSLIHPGRRRDLLRKKRDRLIDKLVDRNILDKQSAELAKAEPIPTVPRTLPDHAPELLTTLQADTAGLISTTLDLPLQRATRRIMERHAQRLAPNGIHNMAVLIVDNQSQQVRVYAGNTPHPQPGTGGYVDIIRARRSPGSTLKPLLYASALEHGTIWPRSFIADVPTQYGSYRPENYHRAFQGMVPAAEALAASLNVPMVRLLHQYGVDRFLDQLHRLGFVSLDRTAAHYGLSLILGGGEVSLWELVRCYSRLARDLQIYVEHSGRYDHSPMTTSLQLVGPLKSQPEPKETTPLALGAGPLYHMFEAMRRADRPPGEANWEFFSSASPLAWKTGTSFGFKDAWAIGVTPRWTWGVWVGNADGSPSPQLTGLSAAAPILFDLVDLVQTGPWFPQPWDDLQSVSVCSTTGFPVSRHCPTDSLSVPFRPTRPKQCSFHRQIWVEGRTGLRVPAHWEGDDPVSQEVFLQLPPAAVTYYRQLHPNARLLPPWHARVTTSSNRSRLEMLYPPANSELIIPVNLNGERQAVEFQIAHRDQTARVYWHLDGTYLGWTEQEHKLSLAPLPGAHLLVLVDDQGGRLETRFDVLK